MGTRLRKARHSQTEQERYVRDIERITPYKRSKRSFAFAILLLVLAGVAFFKDGYDRTIQSLGVTACIAAAYLIRKSMGRFPTPPTNATEVSEDSKTTNQSGV